MNSGARRLAMRSSTGPTRPPSPPMVWHLAHWTLLLGSKKIVPASRRIARQIRLPGGASRGTLQTADEEQQLGDLIVFQGIAEFFHGRLGNAVADRVDDVRVGAAVAELLTGEVRPLAAAPRAAVTAAAQAAVQRLALGQRSRVGLGLGRFWSAGLLTSLHRLSQARRERPERTSHQACAEHDPGIFGCVTHRTGFSFSIDEI